MSRRHQDVARHSGVGPLVNRDAGRRVWHVGDPRTFAAIFADRRADLAGDVQQNPALVSADRDFNHESLVAR
jgi:hypothetical protein